jgi:general stress protein 26
MEQDLKTYVEVEGTASIKNSDNVKENRWNDEMKPWIDRPNDPNYVVLEIKPQNIRLMKTKENSPKLLEF